jgi:hypothetical protein
VAEEAETFTILGYNGNSGGTTSFGSLISATGGGGGQGGSGVITAGGPGGSGTGSALIQTGQYGSDAPQNASNNNETGGNGGGTGNGRGATGYANGLPAIGYGAAAGAEVHLAPESALRAATASVVIAQWSGFSECICQDS